jgi:hypothetical protein
VSVLVKARDRQPSESGSVSDMGGGRHGTGRSSQGTVKSALGKLLTGESRVPAKHDAAIKDRITRLYDNGSACLPSPALRVEI